MKSEFVRIYSEQELRHKVQQTTALLKQMKEQVKNFHFCDISALKDMWIQYESTRYIVSESMLLEERYDKDDPESLFIERQVENDYSDDLHDPDSLHNGLVSMQFLYESIQGFLLCNAYDILPTQYQDKRLLVEEIGADVYMQLNPVENNEFQKMTDILEWVNYQYLYDTDEYEVLVEDVEDLVIDKTYNNTIMLEKLVSTLDLVEEK
jgi:hypothetical protein